MFKGIFSIQGFVSDFRSKSETKMLKRNIFWAYMLLEMNMINNKNAAGKGMQKNEFK